MERAHHQKLVKDYGRLQQRLENLQSDMDMLSPTGGGGVVGGGHRRTPSGISNLSLESESSASTERTDAVRELKDEEVGRDKKYNRILSLEAYWEQLSLEQRADS